MTDSARPKRVYFTFGNHMHWVDMQWLWGYSVLPGSVRDMLHLCRETGVRGNVNFDGVGYEKMAAECPEALADLRAAVRDGSIESVGCSYGQPYGLFHGAESNIRQFTYGVRATRRLLGVRPRAFWEEEFYFFPQLPQILAQCGYTGANLFFQWTWHTPEIPKEPHALVLWEGIDGTRLPALPRNELNLHQWPEDFAPLFESSLLRDLDAPAIVQWIELMPSRDWMCRSEVLLPKLEELLVNPDLEITPATMSETIEALVASANDASTPVRAYTMDEVWHGMTLGKNADRHPRTSRRTELLIHSAETLAAVASLFGRPYPSWDVYPTWELDEAWRELLAAQHHDNHECEGLCGFVGYHQMERAQRAACEVAERTLRHLGARAGVDLVSNGAGFARRGADEFGRFDIPPFGYAALRPMTGAGHDVRVHDRDDGFELSRGSFRVLVDRKARITQIFSEQFPDGAFDENVPVPALRMIVDGAEWRPGEVLESRVDPERGRLSFSLAPDTDAGEVPDLQRGPTIQIGIVEDADAVVIRIKGIDAWSRPDPGLLNALRLSLSVNFPLTTVRADTPYAVHPVHGSGKVRRKYPRGDWMTSQQWFEEIEGAFTSHSLVDLLRSDGAGLLLLHDGSQQMSRTDAGVEVVLNAYDPWDEQRYELPRAVDLGFRLEPHGPLSDADRVRRAIAFGYDSIEHSLDGPALRTANHPGAVGGGAPAEPGTAPEVFGPVSVENAPGVIATAFYRESMKSGEHFPEWAGHRMFRESNGACDHPFVVRLVEFNGEPAEVTLKLPGRVALAARTNLMGEVGAADGHERPAIAGSSGFGPGETRWLEVEFPRDPPGWMAAFDHPIAHNGKELEWSAVRFTMRPREIATIMADLVMGRKEWRDLDAKREVWATIHRTPERTGDNS
ncbi:MAG: hypothetical protein ACF8PN_10050 [Phycisphaerales bacterium]